ncbi:vWA domain-containing protein [Parafrankia discariae]|uniref:vWA domain-containing protein n=1 Tax=Parafrankia discariae TaxID=365528 RepID=UPI000369B2E8|nr:VWA domain-containing protein [Parafrankia discariae]
MSTCRSAGPDPLVALTGFARALRGAGAAADASRVATAVQALTHLDPTSAADVYWAGRLALCAEPDDLARYDALFDEWFRGRPAAGPDRPGPGAGATAPSSRVVRAWPSSRAGTPGDDGDDSRVDPLPAGASDVELLRHRDVADLSPAERAEIDRLVGLLAPRVGSRPSRRRRAGGNRGLDPRRTVRAMLRDGGEPGELVRARPRVRPRRLVFLVDVSGSMSPYADVMLRFAHAAVRVAPFATEVFTCGTRLTRLTRPLRLRDAGEALRVAGEVIPDWSGGTRLGESLRAFLDLWGQRGTARQAVVVIVSDGWERGDVTLLAGQMARLARLAHRVLWVNPHTGRAGFTPTAAGMSAALPHVDDLLAGHTFEALRGLAEVITDA